MKLFYTPLSHFSRKVRVLLDLYGVEVELVNVQNVAQSEPGIFGGNPLMAVPVLIDAGQMIIDSNYIAEYLVGKLDSSDRYSVLSRDPSDLLVRAVLDGIMSNEVALVIGERTGIKTRGLPFFEKRRLAIKHGLELLNQNVERFSDSVLKFKEIHLICSLEHLFHYELVGRDEFPRLTALCRVHSSDARVSRSRPV